MKSIALVAICLLFSVSLNAQTRVVKGKLTTFNRYPVKNVMVESKKAGSSVMTDSLGDFSLVCMEKDVIKIKNDVFEAVSQKIGEEDRYVSANLIFKDSKKNRDVATGMGYISQDQLTFALTHLSDENNDFCNYTNVFQLVQGKVADLYTELNA